MTVWGVLTKNELPGEMGTNFKFEVPVIIKFYYRSDLDNLTDIISMGLKLYLNGATCLTLSRLQAVLSVLLTLVLCLSLYLYYCAIRLSCSSIKITIFFSHMLLK